MNEIFKKLNSELDNLAKNDWIVMKKNFTGSAGCNLERLLKINSGNFEIPDYNGIEIKTSISFKKISYIKLFTANPDGKFLFEIERIRENYGYPDKDLKNHKVFNNSFYCSKKTYINFNYFNLVVDKKQEKIYFHIYNNKKELIDNNTFWTFDLLKEKLTRKLSYLAIIDVITKKDKDKTLYKYGKKEFYKLKSFEKFIELIEKGSIRISFSIGVFKSGKRLGDVHNHGTGFSIQTNKISDLFEKIKMD